MSHKPLWKNDKIQFARLLCEIQANIAVTNAEWSELCASMDLTPDQVNSLFERASKTWENSKRS